MLLRIEIGEQLIRYTPPGRPNRTDFATFAREVSSIRYKGIAYKGFFGPVLKVLADLRVFSTEASWAKGFLRSYSIYVIG